MGRITGWDTTPNKAVALGVNVILFANLAWTAALLASFIRHCRPFEHLDRWQTRYLSVYAAWEWIVVMAIPPLFGFS